MLAIASSAGVKLKIDDFTRIGKRVPVLADLRPSGRYSMSELVAVGGIQPLMKTLLFAGLLHGDCLTVTGQIRRNLSAVARYPDEPPIVRPLSDPIKTDEPLGGTGGISRPRGRSCKNLQARKPELQGHSARL